MQKTMGPRWKAMRPRSSVTAGLACTTGSHIEGELHLIAGRPAAPNRQIFSGAARLRLGLPFTATLFFSTSPGCGQQRELRRRPRA